MTDLQTAAETLINSPEFKANAKKDPKLRIYAARVKNKELGTGGLVNLLKDYGYDIAALDKSETAKIDFAESL